MKFGALNRREILRLAGKAGLASAGAIFLGNCKGTTTPDGPEPPPPPPPPVQVEVLIKFYNHTQGYLGEKAYTGMSGQWFYVSILSLGYNGIDSYRIAVRKAAAREIMGAFVGFSRNGSISLQYPSSNESWEAYLMNAGAQEYYQYVDVDSDMGIGWGALMHPRDLGWTRSDWDRTGPDEPIFEAVRQLASALDHPWKVYGSYPMLGGVSIGYAQLTGIYQEPAYWLLNDLFIKVDPERAPTDVDKLKWFVDAIFGYSTATFRLGGNGAPGRNETICDQVTGNLNSIGRDLLAYVYVKDVR